MATEAALGFARQLRIAGGVVVVEVGKEEGGAHVGSLRASPRLTCNQAFIKFVFASRAPTRPRSSRRLGNTSVVR